jgi:mRNA interferase ChpB
LKTGDIFLVSLDPALGHEQQGTRPVLVISSAEYSQRMNMPIIAPITGGGDFARVAGFTVSLSGCGTRTTGVVRCDQLRSLDLRARNAKRLETVPPFVMEEVLQTTRTYFWMVMPGV